MSDSLTGQLLPHERVLWEGKPGTGIILRPVEAFLIPFSLLWGGFALFWNVSVWAIDGNGADLPFKLFGLPFLVAGLYITVGRFWLDMRIRGNLAYLVTDRRILICKRGRSSTSKSIDIKRLPALEFDERSDGTGTIRFGASGNWFNGGNFGIWQPTFDQTPQFIRIADVRAVYELIQKQAA
ncbi:PH domain-containing protein [Sphingomonas alpina]|uniref:PH domain-containing protein n=1 Tax=Sphingomonas alpina TaxID=653931 RepID=A0A7H0LJT9_9SPHN|nr:PH domain-containing protein [Sphingomonas alpina]QNQ09942.1 PH domain-containing protein [Sphingomonas alpina]